MSESENQESLLVRVKTNTGKIENMELERFRAGGTIVLCFRNEVVEDLLAKLGMKLEINEQGVLEISSSFGTLPLGTNSFGLIGLRAVDIARLPYKEQCIWVAHQCPENELPQEIEKEELENRTTTTPPPESLFHQALESINHAFYSKFGAGLLKGHDNKESLVEKIHRFQAINEEKLWQLAKSIVKVSIERMDRQALLDALGENETDSATLELLRELLAKNKNENYAHEKMKPLFGVCDLAKADTDLPSSNIQSCYTCLGINQDVPYILQAIDLLQSVTRALEDISEELR